MTQSMSRVAHCIDNGPMEGFWGILKRKRYYGRRFTSKHELVVESAGGWYIGILCHYGTEDARPVQPVQPYQKS